MAKDAPVTSASGRFMITRLPPAPPTAGQVQVDAMIQLAHAIRALAYHVERIRQTGDELPQLEADMETLIVDLRAIRPKV